MEVKKEIANFEKEISKLAKETKIKIKTIKTKNLEEKSDIRNNLSIKWERLTPKIDSIRLKIGEL